MEISKFYNMGVLNTHDKHKELVFSVHKCIKFQIYFNLWSCKLDN